MYQRCAQEIGFQRRLFGIHGSLMKYTYFYTLAHFSPPLSKSKETVYKSKRRRENLTCILVRHYNSFFGLKVVFTRLYFGSIVIGIEGIIWIYICIRLSHSENHKIVDLFATNYTMKSIINIEQFSVFFFLSVH